VTDQSFQELGRFAGWMNRFVGYSPSIIGGWAVYFYNPGGLGSTDIDVVLPDRTVRDKVVTAYLATNGYILRKRAFGEAEWVKEFMAGEKKIDHYLDICTLQDKNLVHGRDIEVPWAIAMADQKKVRVGKSELFIPAPEPLLLLKLKAAWDRSYDIASGGGTPYLRDKLGKDRFDILSLLVKCNINAEKMGWMAAECGFGECARDALSRAAADQAVIDRHGLDRQKAHALARKAEKVMSGLA
jgi:hypothetical protein